MVTVKFELKCCPNKCNFSMLLLAGAGRRCSTRISMAYDALLCSALLCKLWWSERMDGIGLVLSGWWAGCVGFQMFTCQSEMDGSRSSSVWLVGWRGRGGKKAGRTGQARVEQASHAAKTTRLDWEREGPDEPKGGEAIQNS